MINNLIIPKVKLGIAQAFQEAGFTDGGDNFRRYEKEVFHKLPKNSQKALLSDWHIYCRFCQENSFKPTAPSELEMIRTITAFVNFQAVKVKASTLSRRIASIRTMLSIMKVPNPLVSDEILKQNIKYTIANISAPAKQAKPMQIDCLMKIIGELNLSKITELRAAVIIAFAYDTMARASEIRQIKIEHISKKQSGTATVLIERSKTDRSAVGSYRFISNFTLELIDKWLAFTGIRVGYLFQPVNARGNCVWGKDAALEGTPIGYSTILRAYRLACIDQGYSAHSTRVGSALDQISANIPDYKIQLAGGWKSSTMLSYYGRKLDADDNGSAQLAKIQGR